MESSSLVAIPGSRLPEMLGNFHLDNHHVEEWSDPSEPGLKHRARKEVGKWVNLEKNADIHYQKREDSKKSDRSKERSRTEVIQGTAPDSTFQVVRSHRQYQDGDDTSGSTMQQSSSTSYHVSSSRGVRSTTKTTSNKTTTKTVSVSGGGGRADDFENLRMSFTPLDTSTQRERINVSRSGTMGIRRPPTRRHTPAALICSSPEDGSEAQRPEDGQILVDSDDNLRDTPDPGKTSEQSGLSIVGFKNISPKIRVGFPVEIQLELQTKLRSSSTLERDHAADNNNEEDDDAEVNFAEHGSSKETDDEPSSRVVVEQPAAPLPIPLCGLSGLSSRESTFDFRERRKSFLSESFESSSKENNNQQSNPLFGNLALRHSTSLRQLSSSNNRNDESNGDSRADSGHQSGSHQRNNGMPTTTTFLSKSSGSSSSHAERPTGMSWDLIQNMRQGSEQQTQTSKLFSSTLSSGNSSGEDFVGTTQFKFSDSSNQDTGTNSANNSSRFADGPKDSFSHRLKNINNNGANGNNNNKKTVVTLNASQESLEYDRKSLELNDSLEKYSLEEEEDDEDEKGKISFDATNEFQYHRLHHHHHHHHHHHSNNNNNESQVVSTPDVLHHENSSSTSLSPSLERSRKLLKMLDETPDLLNKMSFRSYFSNSEKEEAKDWEDKDDMDWETQRQLSFLNDSLSRILDESRSIENMVMGGGDGDKTGVPSSDSERIRNGLLESADPVHPMWAKGTHHHEHELDFNGNFKELGKMSQVSQTWISSVDHKPSQTVRDHDVVTSISATNDAYKKGPKKVEFCKTEVHFTPDSGRFNIVETDENKPSTAHLFRRKKRSEKKSSSSSTSSQQATASDPVSPYSSSSSMSSLESTTDKHETAYILEMQVETENHGSSSSLQHGERKKSDGMNHTIFSTSLLNTEATSAKSQRGGGDSSSRTSAHGGREDSAGQGTLQWEKKSVENVTTAEDAKDNSLPLLTSSKFGGADKLVAASYNEMTDTSHRVLVNLENLGQEEFEDDIRSPSHTILSNYGEMKIQRYLKQLKSPSSREGSSSPTMTHDNEDDSHFRFDNILYENGSFVPLATRRSLIEMNNRNRKRLNVAASQSSDNSSTTSTYSLPNSDKDQYGTLRLGTLEATVATRGAQPQITQVEFRYTNNNNNRPHHHHHQNSDHLDNNGKTGQQQHDFDYHSLSVRERRERFSLVPSPVMPHPQVRVPMRHSIAVSPTDSHASDASSNRPSSSTFLSKKPPTPILPFQFSAFEKAGAELRERFYAKSIINNSNNTSSCLCIASDNEATDGSSARPSTLREDGKLSTKSIVTIGGGYTESTDTSSTSKQTDEMIMTATTVHSDAEPLSPEPLLSLDHTWKGPAAHYDSPQQDTSQRKSSPPVPKSLTFPKSTRTEPEWVSKAKSRETRVTDWSLIEKQQQSTPTRNTEPPWISEIRFRNKPIPNEELKSLPKISVVYPWQRDNSSKESSVERSDLPDPEVSHIVSIVPEPSMSSTTTTTTHQKEEKQRLGSYDLYSGKSLPPIKSLKAVPEVSVPSRAGKSFVEVNNAESSSSEQYLSSTPKRYHHHQLQSRKETKVEAQHQKVETLTKKSSEKKSSSMRITSETSGTIPEEARRDVETYPKKSSSRKPLQATQANKEISRGTTLKFEEKSRTQPKPPKPPTRFTSLSNNNNNKGTAIVANRDPPLMTIPPFQESSRYHKDNRVSSSSTSNTNTYTGSTLKKSGRRKSDMEESPGSSRANTPVHHRHPTIQITKLPMRTTNKATVVEGKRLSGACSKSKSKHHAALSSSGTENVKSRPEPIATLLNTSNESSSTTTSSRDREAIRRQQRKHHDQSRGGLLASKGAYGSPSQTLKTCSRSPTSESDSKKRRTAVLSGGGGDGRARK